MEQDRKSHQMILIFFLALYIISIGFMGWLLRPFFSILVLAFVVTGVFTPIYRLLLKKMKPGAASGLTCVIIFLVLFIPTLLFAGIVVSEAVGFLDMVNKAALPDQIRTFINNSTLLETINQHIDDYGIVISGAEITQAASQIGQFVGGFLLDSGKAVVSNVLNFVLNFLFMVLIIFFILIDGGKLVDYLVDMSPLPQDQDEKLVAKFKDMSGAVILGNGVCGLAQGILGGAVFALFGLPSPFLWGVVMGILAFLPIVGIGVVFLPAAIIMFIQGKIATGVFFIIFYSILSFSVEYVIKPKLVGDRVQMHPLLVFLAIMGGLKIFGILGVIYGPLIVTFFLTLADIYRASYKAIVEA
ncbi:AI-2E family transporter [Desulfatibacillum aliphaticivorans]|uniref:AI-2E family transporter n=1 Tax=Desulfatibacillum aliphaticivorans TaxID=218208 RepID=UPI00042597E0|nr:AI-2E family transporter [Desulfatibacillum aliphaticivorans]